MNIMNNTLSKNDLIYIDDWRCLTQQNPFHKQQKGFFFQWEKKVGK